MTTNKINAESMQKVYDENYQTFLKKNADYGSSFEESLNEFGEVAGIVRISDKYRRLVNITKNENKVLESKIDTLKDMANYCLMLAVWLEEL
ncbi:TPA: nucleotide modification associated domain-containing protein [Streptococcus suis]